VARHAWRGKSAIAGTKQSTRARAKNSRKQDASSQKLTKMKMLAFAFFYFSESGLFKGLHAIQAIKNSLSFFSPKPVISRDAGWILTIGNV
jgi:hypothetical protein